MGRRVVSEIESLLLPGLLAFGDVLRAGEGGRLKAYESGRSSMVSFVVVMCGRSFAMSVRGGLDRVAIYKAYCTSASASTPLWPKTTKRGRQCGYMRCGRMQEGKACCIERSSTSCSRLVDFCHVVFTKEEIALRTPPSGKNELVFESSQSLRPVEVIPLLHH